mgnify:FL=1
MTNSNIARIGMVNFINTAPIYEMWKEKVHPQNWQVVEAVPTVLNRMLAEGELDLGFVSSHEYGRLPESYRLLADLSISANGPVGSVFLFSHCSPNELDGQLVLLSGQSQTSVYLLKIILEEFYGVCPVFQVGDVREATRKGWAGAGVLAIGDDALRLQGTEQFSWKLDLGEVWKEHTNLPFVFAVFAVREEFCRDYPDLLAQIHRELVRCRHQGLCELELVSRLVAPRIPMDPELCFDYLQGIEHDLDLTKQQALNRFFQYLIARGEASQAALPLKIVPLKP